MSLTHSQLMALAIVPKVTGGLSFFFSAATAVYIMLESHDVRKKFYHRLMLGMSLADLSSSIWFTMSTWPIPKDSGALYAIGNEASCRVQGFGIQFAISSAIYNSSLGFFYLLAVKYGWKDSALRKWQLAFHGIPLVWAISSAIAALQLDIFHSANLWCWIGPNPDGSGPDVNIYRMAFFYGPLWTSILVVTICLCLVFSYVRDITLKTEAHTQSWMTQQASATTESPTGKIEGYVNSNEDELYRDQGFGEDSIERDRSKVSTVSLENSERHNYEAARVKVQVGKKQKALIRSFMNRRSDATDNLEAARVKRKVREKKNEEIRSFTNRRREVAYQCLRFAVAFYITWIPITTVRILQIMETPVPYGLLLSAATLTPFQGLPNLAVFLFPILKKKWKSRKKVLLQPHPQKPKVDVPKRSVVHPEEPPLDAETGKTPPSGETPPSQTSDERIANTVVSSFKPRSLHSDSHVQHLSSNNPESDPEPSYTHPETYKVAARKTAREPI
jgi:hypothetical protein